MEENVSKGNLTLTTDSAVILVLLSLLEEGWLKASRQLPLLWES